MKRYFALTQLLAVAGAVVVVNTFAFSASTARAIDFAIAIAVTVAGIAGVILAPSRAQRALMGAATAIGAWTILVTVGIFSGSTQRWLDFAAGAAIAGVGVLAGSLYESRRGSAVGPVEAAANGHRPGVETRIAQPVA
jgi:hypothetical protein